MNRDSGEAENIVEVNQYVCCVIVCETNGNIAVVDLVVYVMHNICVLDFLDCSICHLSMHDLLSISIQSSIQVVKVDQKCLN